MSLLPLRRHWGGQHLAYRPSSQQLRPPSLPPTLFPGAHFPFLCSASAHHPAQEERQGLISEVWSISSLTPVTTVPNIIHKMKACARVSLLNRKFFFFLILNRCLKIRRSVLVALPGEKWLNCHYSVLYWFATRGNKNMKMFWWKADTCQAHKLVQLGEALNFGGALDLSQQFSLPSAPPLLLWCSTELSPPPPPAHLPFAFCLWCSVRAARCSSSLFKTLYAFTLLCVAVDTSLRLRCVFSHCKTEQQGLHSLLGGAADQKAGGAWWDGCGSGWHRTCHGCVRGLLPSRYLQSGGSAELLGKIK